MLSDQAKKLPAQGRFLLEETSLRDLGSFFYGYSFLFGNAHWV